jgi:hypothetical protein
VLASDCSEFVCQSHQKAPSNAISANDANQGINNFREIRARPANESLFLRHRYSFLSILIGWSIHPWLYSNCSPSITTAYRESFDLLSGKAQ